VPGSGASEEALEALELELENVVAPLRSIAASELARKYLELSEAEDAEAAEALEISLL